MKHLARIVALGDSILKGVQVDPVSKRYVTRNEIGIPDLERDFDLTVRNDSHFGASTVPGARLPARVLARGGGIGVWCARPSGMTSFPF